MIFNHFMNDGRRLDKTSDGLIFRIGNKDNMNVGHYNCTERVCNIIRSSRQRHDDRLTNEFEAERSSDEKRKRPSLPCRRHKQQQYIHIFIQAFREYIYK